MPAGHEVHFGIALNRIRGRLAAEKMDAVTAAHFPGGVRHTRNDAEHNQSLNLLS
jgi:hypothetical protein